MKILILNYEYPPLGGGAATATENILRQFAEQEDLEVDLVTSSAGKARTEQLAPNIRIHFLDIGKQGDLHNQSQKDLLVYSWKAFWKSRRLLSEQHYDVTHAFFGIPCGFLALMLNVFAPKTQGLEGATESGFGSESQSPQPSAFAQKIQRDKLLRKGASRRHKIPFVVSLRGSDVPFYSEKYYWLDRLFFSWLSRIIWQKAAAVIANSEDLKKLALKNSPKQKIGVIYNGVDCERFKALEGDSDEVKSSLQQKNDHSQSFQKREAGGGFTVVSTSRIIARKGMDCLVRAAISLARQYPNFKLLLAGGGDQLKDELIQLVKEERLEEQIQFVGNIERDKIADFYRRGDVFALPSLNEGMSNSLLEAMASGLAVVATKTGGTAELVDESSGLIVKKKSAQSIQIALEKLYQNREKLATMKSKSRQKAEQMSWKKVAEEYQGLYKKVNSSTKRLPKR